jgi:hypothetical protein
MEQTAAHALLLPCDDLHMNFARGPDVEEAAIWDKARNILGWGVRLDYRKRLT